MQSNLPVYTFHRLLRLRDKGLYYKWLYNGELTAQERDTILCVGIRARKLTETK